MPIDPDAGSPPIPVSRFAGIAERMRTQLRRLAGHRGTGTHEVFRHMLVLAAGSGAAKVVGTLSIPIITRLYTPEQYGLFTVFLSVTAILTPLASLRYSAALPLARREGTAAALLVACMALLGLTLALMVAVLLVSADHLFGLVSAAQLVPVWPLLVAAVGTAGVYEILTNWAVRQRGFRTMAQAEVSQSVLGGATKIGLALVSLQRVGLVAGHLVGQIVACLILWRLVWRRANTGIRRTTRKKVWLVLARYTDFPTYRLPSQLLLIASQQAPVFFLSALYGAAIAGQLGLALVALAVPLTLIGQTTGQAFYAEIARLGRNKPDEIHRITCGVMKRMLVLGLVPTVVLMGAGRWLFPLFFGARWLDAGVFASILSIYLLAQFVANPLSHTLSVFDKQRLFLRFNIVRAILIAGVFGVAYWLRLSAFMAIAAYSVVLSIHYAITSYTIFVIIRRAIADVRRLP